MTQAILSPIARLVANIEAIPDHERHPPAITKKVAKLAAPLAQDQSWIEPACREVDDEQGIGVHILYQADNNGLLIETVCWQPGRGVTPHDHQTWGVVVGLMGEEMNTSWRRLDDKSRTGHAVLEEENVTLAKRGDVIQLLPDDIHSVRNVGSTPAMSLHIYGNNLEHTGRSEFDLKNETERPCRSRKKSR